MLFSFDYATELPALRDGFQDHPDGFARYVWVDPENPGTLKQRRQGGENWYADLDFGKGFDLTGFRQVLFGVEARYLEPVAEMDDPFEGTTVQAWCGEVGPNGGRIITQRPCGTGNEFGSGVGVNNTLHLGSGYASAQLNSVTSYLPPFAHFYFWVEGNPPLYRLDGEFLFRFWAVGY
ncbi:hypothetical protein ACN28S_23870 [Cystobacter fuscus]